MPMIEGKRALLQLLRQEGVETMFGNPGTTELPLMDALAVEPGTSYILALQEAAAMSMADGYAQSSGKLGVVNLHVAPGLGNAMGMLYDARKASSPVLVTAGQHDQAFTFQEPILWSDLVELARPFVKSSTEVRRIEDLPRAIHRAAKEALSPPMGPVFLSLPVDVLNAAADIDLGHATRVAPGIRGDAAAIAEAAKMLLAARSPVIVAGDAVSQGRALEEVVRLAELLGCYVYLEGVASTTNFPTTHPQYFGQVLRLSPLIRETLKPHDVMLSLGGDLFTQSLPTKVEPLPDGIKVIHLDTDPREIGKNFPATIGILGEPKASVPDLIAEIEKRLGGPARTKLAARRKATEAAAAERRAKLFADCAAQAKLSPIRPFGFLKTVADLLPKDAVVVEETLSSADRIREIIPSLDAKSFFGMRGGGIGWGLPAAIGVKLGQPDRPVVALIGDGSSMYTIQALWTAAHHRIGCIVFMILNNGSYRILKQRMNAMRSYAAQTDTWPGMDLDDPPIDFVSIARAMGLKDALSGNEPVLIEVKLDKGFKPV